MQQGAGRTRGGGRGRNRRFSLSLRAGIMDAAGRGRNSSRVRSLSRTEQTLQKLEKCVETGNYYEAQQMYKTVYARYVGAKNYAAALELLQSGTTIQLRHGQVTCGVELGVLLVETLGKAGMKYDILALEQIKSVASSFPRKDWEACNRSRKLAKTSEAYLEAKARVDGFCTFMKAAIRWCIETGGPSRGPPELHDVLAEYIWTQYPEMELNRASIHFVRSGHPEKYVRALIACMEECDPEEADLILARSVLLYLTLGNLRDANRLMREVRGLGKQSYPNAPLVQFLKYLLLTLERDALPLLQSLCESYRDQLGRDSTFTESLDTVTEKFYGVQHKNGLQRMLGDFVKMFAAE